MGLSAEPGYLAELRELCTRHGALLDLRRSDDRLSSRARRRARAGKRRPRSHGVGKDLGGGCPWRVRRPRRRHGVSLSRRAGLPSGDAVGKSARDDRRNRSPWRDRRATRRFTLGSKAGGRVWPTGSAKNMESHGVAHTAFSAGSMFSLFFAPEPIDDLEAHESRIGALFAKYFGAMLDRGVYLAPSPFETNFHIDRAHDRPTSNRRSRRRRMRSPHVSGDRMIDPKLQDPTSRRVARGALGRGLHSAALCLSSRPAPSADGGKRDDYLARPGRAARTYDRQHADSQGPQRPGSARPPRAGLCDRSACGAALAWVLGLEHDWRIAIVGFGYLGRAFATFITARETALQRRGIYDARRTSSVSLAARSPLRTSPRWNGSFPEAGCNIAVISVPAEAAAGKRAARRRSRHSRDPQLRADAARSAGSGDRTNIDLARRDGDTHPPV